MMATTRRKKVSKNKTRSKFRASWRGQVRFGLVAFDVQAINAEIKEKGEIHFHLLHARDHKRIHYAKICPTHGQVPNDEIVEGYEYGKERYVEFDKDELDALRTDREKALTVDSFIAPADLDPIYFDGRMYFLIPDGVDAAESYTIVEEAMIKQDRWGVGQVVFSGREQLAVVRPLGGLLTMSMLSYQDEIRKPADFHGEFTRPRTTPRKIKLAEDLIRNWTEKDFDLGEYHDRYRQKVKQLVDAKVQGREVVAPEEEEEPAVVNLIDALKRSVAQRKGKSSQGGKTQGAKKRGAANSSRRRRA
jgi:DNA end-binding protein Ku